MGWGRCGGFYLDGLIEMDIFVADSPLHAVSRSPHILRSRSANINLYFVLRAHLSSPIDILKSFNQRKQTHLSLQNRILLHLQVNMSEKYKAQPSMHYQLPYPAVYELASSIP